MDAANFVCSPIDTEEAIRARHARRIFQVKRSLADGTLESARRGHRRGNAIR